MTGMLLEKKKKQTQNLEKIKVSLCTHLCYKLWEQKRGHLILIVCSYKESNKVITTTAAYLYSNDSYPNPLTDVNIVFNERSKTLKFTSWVNWKIL